MSTQQYNPLHPSAFIKRVYLEFNNIDPNQLARQLADAGQLPFDKLKSR